MRDVSKRFLARLAGGVALGSAALLLGTPVAAFASDGYDDYDKYDKYEYSKSDERNGVVCGNIDQFNEQFVGNFVVGNDIEDSDVDIDQDAAAVGTNAAAVIGVICVRDVEVDVDVEADLLD